MKATRLAIDGGTVMMPTKTLLWVLDAALDRLGEFVTPAATASEYEAMRAFVYRMGVEPSDLARLLTELRRQVRGV